MNSPRLGFLTYLILIAGCGTGPERSPSLARSIAGTVTDSLGGAVRAHVHANFWRGEDSIAGGVGQSDGAGVYSIEWYAAVPPVYDSLVLVSDGSVGPTIQTCRPYSVARVVRTSAQLADLPGDSAHVPIVLGLGKAAPALAPGVFGCALAHQPFGDGTSDFVVELAIESAGTAPGDSVRGQWRIFFRETRSDLVGFFGGVVAVNTVDLALHMAQDNYVECEPGYRLSIAIDGTQRLGDGSLETLNPDEPVCPVEQLEPLRFVEFVPPLFAEVPKFP